MYELVQAGSNIYYIDCPSKVGVYICADGKSAWLIDSGNDKDMARRICRVLDGQGWQLEGIANTHSHADHIGANAALVKRTGCKIVGTGMENALTRYTLLEPTTLYGGYPPEGLRNKFLMAAESVPDSPAESGLPGGLTHFPLPGHSFDMCGYRTDDGIVFVADSISPQNGKNRLFFLYDVQAYLDTLDALAGMEAKLFIPSHSPATDDIGDMLENDRQSIQNVIARLLDICRQPTCFDDILKAVFDGYGMTMNLPQYALTGSTIRSYLAFLCNTGELHIAFDENKLYFHI